MKKIETHPSPEKLLRQVTEEAVNALALGGPDKIGDEAPMEAGVMLIAKAWGLPQESLQASLDLLAKERQLLRSGSGEDAPVSYTHLNDQFLLSTHSHKAPVQ